MKKELLALSIITALSACGGGSNDNTTAQTAPIFSGDVSAVLSKAANPSLTIKVEDSNTGESLIFPEVMEGKYGKFEINAAGEWDYTLFSGEEEHPEVTALVSSADANLTENPFVIKSADGTTQTVQITLEGIDVPATFRDSIIATIAHDTGSITAKTSVRDDNPAEAAFKPALEQMGADEVDGVTQIQTMYGVATITVTEPVIGVEGVEAVDAVPAVPATDTTPEIPAVEAVEGVTAVAAVLGRVDWAYEIDPTNEAVKALDYDVTPDDITTIPTLADTFTLTTLDGTEQPIVITIKGSLKVPADIDALPGGIDVELTEEQVEAGESPVVNPITEVNINVPDASGSLVITDPNLAEEFFEVQEDATTTYGSFSIDADGAWTYALNTELDVIKDHKGDGVTLPNVLTDEIIVNAVDGTEATLPITINPLVGGNLGAQLGGPLDGKWVMDINNNTSIQGKASFIARFPEASTKDVKLVFSGRTWKGTELHRTYLALTVRASGELRLNNETGNGKYHTLNDTVVKGQPFLVEFTWDGTGGLPATLSLAIDGTPISSSAMTFNSDNTFTSMTVGSSLQNLGPGFFDVQTKGGTTFEIDDFKIYSDVAGTEVNMTFEETFESADDNDILEGKAITVDYLSSKSSNPVALSVPLTKPE